MQPGVGRSSDPSSLFFDHRLQKKQEEELRVATEKAAEAEVRAQEAEIRMKELKV